MKNSGKRFWMMVGLAFCCWVGKYLFSYITCKQIPHVILEKLADQGSYKDIIEAKAHVTAGYTINTINLELDGKYFETPPSIVRRKNITIFPLIIDTTKLPNGPHKLSIKVTDASYQKNTFKQLFTFFVDNDELSASFDFKEYSILQGKTLYVKINSNKTLKPSVISLLHENYPLHQDRFNTTTYEALIPIECEQQVGKYNAYANLEDKAGHTAKLQIPVEIKESHFKKQIRQFSMASKLENEKSLSMKHSILYESILKWQKHTSPIKRWEGAFEFPTIVQRMSTPHGELRISPERGRYRHKGVDIVNTPRGVVWAAQNGKVIIKERFLITGNTVVIDHGLGVCTLYAHLDSFSDIEVDDEIKTGNPIGKIGKTGYASGYHLHWELLVQGVSVDPVEWTTRSF
jgi:murein DD-endopeptidase MepM/ murein hydrolase activator NlpD